MIGNGSQLCAMVAITLGMRTSPKRKFLLIFLRSICFTWIPLTFEPGFVGYSDDDFLVSLWMVCDLNRSGHVLIVHSIGGYASSRAYTTLGGANRKKNALVTATALPTLVPFLLHCLHSFTPLNSLIFAIVFLLNFFLLIAGSSGAVPFGKEVSSAPRSS